LGRNDNQLLRAVEQGYGCGTVELVSSTTAHSQDVDKFF
jgi:hypothetical protein